MVKKYKTGLAILLVILVAVSVITVTGVFDINRIVKEKEESANPELIETYKDIFSTYTDENNPLLSTDIEGVFYAMSTAGDVTFYRAENGALTQLEESRSIDIKVECSGQKLPATLHCIDVDGKTIGYGLFTNELYPDVLLYDYAFFKLTDMFPAYNSSGSRMLLLADIDKARFYKEDKVFSEQFYLYSDNTTEHFLNENQRIVDMYARQRSDYKMFTSDILSQDQDIVYFFSSRQYTAFENSNQADILRTGGSGENVDNLVYISDIDSLHFWRTDEGVYYFSKNDDKSFTLKFYNGSEDTDIKTFEGSINDNYLICGEYILNKASGEVYRITDGTVRQLDYSDFKRGFEPSLFDISENGKYCVIRGSNNRNKPAFAAYDLEVGSCVSYIDDIFGYIASINVTDDGTMIISLATGDSASSYYQITGVIGQTATEGETSGTEPAAEETTAEA